MTTGAVLWRAKTVGAIDEVFAGDGLIIVVTAGPGRLTLLRPGGQVIWSVPETVYHDIPLTVQPDMTWVDTGTDLIDVRDLVYGEPATLVDRRLSDGTARWSVTLGGLGSDATVARPAGGNLIVTKVPGNGSIPPTALAVDPATGHVRAAARLAASAASAPAVVGGDTLLEVSTSPCL